MRRISAQERESQISRLCEGTVYSFLGWVGTYTGVTSSTMMTCKKHGNWSVRLQNLLSGRRCPTCAREYTGVKNQKDLVHFLKRACEIHADKYDYSSTIYVKSTSDVQIICKIHGVFKQKPCKHLSGRGCPKCGTEARDNFKRDNLDSFLQKALSLHGHRFDYSKTVYEKSSKKVLIGCGVHGFFSQSPNDHLNGRGCPECAVYGFKQHIQAGLYCLKAKEQDYVKIGISNNVEKRIKILKSATPFEFDVLHIIENSGATIAKLEKMFHNEFESAGFSGFDGATEWLKWTPEIQHWLRFLK